MAFTITAYEFSKRENSTKQPTGITGTDYSVVLKDRTSYENPVFLLHSDTVLTFNYVQWGTWYYFVDDIVIEKDELYSVKCSLDVLATYKTEIGATTAFVLYDTSANTEITDRRLSMKTTATVASNTTESDIFEGNSCVVLGITGKIDSGLVAMTTGEANGLMTAVEQWLDDAKAIPWPEDPDPDPDPDDSESDSDPGSNSDDSGNGPGTIYG